MLKRRLDTLAATVARTADAAVPRVFLITHEDPEEAAERDAHVPGILADAAAGRVVISARVRIVPRNREPIPGETPEETAPRLRGNVPPAPKPRP